MEHGDVCPLTENEGSRHQGEDRLPVIKLTMRSPEVLLPTRFVRNPVPSVQPALRVSI